MTVKRKNGLWRCLKWPAVPTTQCLVASAIGDATCLSNRNVFDHISWDKWGTILSLSCFPSLNCQGSPEFQSLHNLNYDYQFTGNALPSEVSTPHIETITSCITYQYFTSISSCHRLGRNSAIETKNSWLPPEDAAKYAGRNNSARNPRQVWSLVARGTFSRSFLFLLVKP